MKNFIKKTNISLDVALGKLINEELNKTLNESITVYHGSDRKFDSFDTSKIGSGDGKSLGGWGIYFSTSEDVARKYSTKNGFVGDFEIPNGPYFNLDDNIDVDLGNKIASRLSRLGTVSDEDIEQLQTDYLSDEYSGSVTNKGLYDWLSYVLGSEKNASLFLEKLGFVGTEFTDKMDRNANNYVVFNSSSIKGDIGENVNEEVIDEATYPENFDLEHFKQLKSFKDRVNYCNSTLKKLGSGSSRIVYLVDDKTVLKLAKNQKGIAQNEVEIGASTDYYSDITAEVYESDENGLWLEMELAKPINKARFQQILGYTVEDFGKWITNFWNVNHAKKTVFRLNKQVEETIDESEFANKVFSFIQDYGLSTGDLGVITSYGEFDGEVKIIDYGLNDDVLNSYYRKIREGLDSLENNKDILNEVEPSEVPTKTIKYTDHLNDKIWDNNTKKLKPIVRYKLLEITKKYLETLKDLDIKFKDIILTGSAANYNYNDQSDLDVHIVVDYNKIDQNKDLLLNYFKGVKDNWSNQYKITIYGIPVEMFVQDEDSKEVSSASRYSLLNDKWVIEPQYEKPKYNIEEIKKIAADFLTRFDDIKREYKVNKKDIQKPINDIEQMKTDMADLRKKGLDSELGEFSNENLGYKLLRNLLFFDKVNKFKEELVHKELSLKETTLLNEYITNNEIYLRDYLSMTDEQKMAYLPHEYYYFFQDFIDETDTEFEQPKETVKSDYQDEDDVEVDMFDNEIELMTWLENNNKEIYNAFAQYLFDKIKNNTLPIDDSEYPAWSYFSNNPQLIKNQWLIHFTNDADGIAKEGFKYGVDEMTKLGLTTHLGEFDKKYGGYNFAYTLADFPKYASRSYVYGGGFKYGKEAVVFNASGIRVWHYGDEEPQVIFYGNTAKNIIPITKGDSGDFAVYDKNGRILFQNEQLDRVVDWVVKNYNQYRKNF